MGREVVQGPSSRMASYIDVRIGHETIAWAPSIKPNNQERAIMVNTVLDLYHAANIYDLTRLTTEIDRRRVPKMKGIKIKTLTTDVTESYNRLQLDIIKHDVGKKPSKQETIRTLIKNHRVANSLAEVRLSFSLQMLTFGNYCESILNEFISTKKNGKKVEVEVASSKYL